MSPDPFFSRFGLRAARLLRHYNRLVLFLLVSALNTAFGYTMFSILFFLSGEHRFAIVFGTVLGVLFNFFTTGRIVFSNRNARALVPFLLGYAVTLSINLIVVELLLDLNFNPYLAQAVTLPLIAAIGYLINSRIVFKT